MNETEDSAGTRTRDRTDRYHYEVWWFYTRLTLAAAEPDGALETAPPPLRAAFRAVAATEQPGPPPTTRGEEKESDRRFYGAGACRFEQREAAIDCYEECRKSVAQYFEREAFDLEFLNFSLLLVGTSEDFDKPLVVKPHTILRKHREESVALDAPTIIRVSESSYVN